MPFNIGPFELLLVLILALLVLGPGKLPEVGSAIGKHDPRVPQGLDDVQDSLQRRWDPTKADAAAAARPVTSAAEATAEATEDRAAC